VTRLHVGTAQVDATLGRGPRAAARLPDDGWVVRVRLGEPIAAARGDRFVLRRSSPAGSAGGGVVLDPAPPVGASRRRITPALLAQLGEAGSDADAERVLLDLHGFRPADPGVAVSDVAALAGWVVAADVEEALSAGIADAVQAASPSGVHLAELRPDVARRLRRLVTVSAKNAAAIAAGLVERLVLAGTLDRDGDLVRVPGATPGGTSPALSAAMDRLEAALDVVAPPALGTVATAVGCGTDGIRALEAAGRIVRLEPDLAYAASAFMRIEAEALRLAAVRPLLPADLRDATGTSRKYVMAILEELGRQGVLRRTSEGHVVGPRAPR
jgi:selenocysteine-specific elongation factor